MGALYNNKPRMSLFGPAAPQGITEKELTYVHGELLNGPSGTRFTREEADDVLDMLRVALMNAGSYAERAHHMNVVDKNEEQSIIGHMDQLSGAKKARLKLVLDKYLTQERTGGALGLLRL